MSVVITEERNVSVNSKELIDTTEYLTLQTRSRMNRCRYNGVQLYIIIVCFCLQYQYLRP
jgi:hypothetical protein